MKPIPLLLRFVIIAPSLRLTIAPLICGATFALPNFMTLIRAISLATPTRATNDHQLAACLAGKFDAVGYRWIIRFVGLLHDFRISKN